VEHGRLLVLLLDLREEAEGAAEGQGRAAAGGGAWHHGGWSSVASGGSPIQGQEKGKGESSRREES